MSKIDFVSGEPSLLELFRALRSSRRSLKERFFYLVGLRPQNLAKILIKILFLVRFTEKSFKSFKSSKSFLYILSDLLDLADFCPPRGHSFL